MKKFEIIYAIHFGFSFLVFTLSPVYAAFEFKETGARAVGLSGAYIANSLDATAPYYNPAGLSFIRKMELASFYNKPFAFDELTYWGPSFALSTPWGGFALASHQFGNSLYREQQIYFSHGFKISKNFSLGYNLKGMFLKIDDFGRALKFGLDAGVLTKMTENLAIALVSRNLNRPAIGSPAETLPSGFVLGFSYRPVAGLWLNADLTRTDPDPVLLKSGIEIKIHPLLSLRGGFKSLSSQFSGGFGVRAGMVRLDYAYSFHSLLPGHHHFTLGFKFGDPQEHHFKFRDLTSKMKTESGTSNQVLHSTETSITRINLNTATAEELEEIEGIGPVTSKRILDYRNQYGFKKMDELLKISRMRRSVFLSLKKSAYVPVPTVDITTFTVIPFAVHESTFQIISSTTVTTDYPSLNGNKIQPMKHDSVNP